MKEFTKPLICCIIALAALVAAVQYTKHRQRQHIQRPEVQEMAEGILADRDRMREELVGFIGQKNHYDELGRDWREFVAERIMEEARNEN